MTHFAEKLSKYLAKAKASMAQGFTSKAAQKQCTSDLNSAYDGLRDTFRNEAHSLYEKDSEGSRINCVANDKIMDAIFAIPMDLHHYRKKHGEIILSMKPELVDIVKSMEELFAIRKEVMAMEISKPKTKAEQMLEDARNLQTPIALEVRKLRQSAIDHAKEQAQLRIDMTHAELDKCDWNSFHIKDGIIDLVRLLTIPSSKEDMPKGREYMHVHHRKPSPEAEAHFIEMAANIAANGYDMFVYKLNSKVGAHKSAELTGNNVWDGSYVTVITEAGEREVWKTQMILNFSKLGTPFNQFPTRKVKWVWA